MQFHFKANAIFQAEDIDDATLKIAKYFLEVALGEPSTLDQTGSIQIYRIVEDTDEDHS